MEQQKTEFNISNDNNYFLQIENSAKAISLIPVTILFVSLLVIGVLGNLLVLYTNTFCIKRSTPRVYILSLAAFDLTTCLLGLPFNILTLIYPLTFVWDYACRALIFSLTFTILGSMFFLDLIAIDRYRKICRPLKKQLSPTETKITCLINVIVSAVFALPMFFIYGSVDIDTRISNVTGKECYISKEYISSDVSMIYDGFTLVLFVVSFFVLGGLYIKVGMVLWKRRHIHNTTQHCSKVSASGTSTMETNVSQINVLKDELEISTPDSVRYKKTNQECIAVQSMNSKSVESNERNLRVIDNFQIASEKEKYIKCSMSDFTSVSCDESMSEVRSVKSKFKSKKQKRTMGITAMLFIVTVVFIISVLPFLIISIINGLVENFWNNMNTGEVVIGNMFMRTYFINNMINPIVYWFLDNQFKQEVRKLFRQCDWSKIFLLTKT